MSFAPEIMRISLIYVALYSNCIWGYNEQRCGKVSGSAQAEQRELNATGFSDPFAWEAAILESGEFKRCPAGCARSHQRVDVQISPSAKAASHKRVDGASCADPSARIARAIAPIVARAGC